MAKAVRIDCATGKETIVDFEKPIETHVPPGKSDIEKLIAWAKQQGIV